MKNVMIPQSLFGMMVKYFLLEDYSLHEMIRQQLKIKFDRLMEHELYTTYRKETDPVKREEARLRYLQEHGVPESFRS